MADTDVSEATEPQTGTDHERIVAVESAVERIEQAISRLVPGSHAQAEQREEARLDRPSNIEDQVRAELARARQEEADAQTAADSEAAAAADAQSVRDRLAKLEEKPPAAPRLRRTHLLGWGDGRA